MLQRASPRSSGRPAASCWSPRRGLERRSPSATRVCPGGRATTTRSARASRAATSTATATPTSRSGCPGASASRCSFGGGARPRRRPPQQFAGADPRRRASTATAPGARPRRRRLRRPGGRRARRRAPTRGAVQLLLGGADGLTRGARGCLRGPRRRGGLRHAHARAATSTATGRLDLVEGGPARRRPPGHLSYCPGSTQRPAPLPWRSRVPAAPRASRSPTSTATATPTSSRATPAHALNQAGLAVSPGQVRLWLGGRRGPRSTPITITQNTPTIPGNDEPGDEFGAVVAAGDLDSDGFAEMMVGRHRARTKARGASR